MDQNKNLSDNLKKSLDLIRGIKGKTLSVEERKKLTSELSALMITEANAIRTRQEKREQTTIARMMQDPLGKAFTTSMIDQVFRCKKKSHSADQFNYLLKQFGMPQYLSFYKKLELLAFRCFGRPFAFLFIPLAIRAIKKETEKVIIPAEKEPFLKYITKRKREKVEVNLNHLGEAILGEKEAKDRLRVYIEELKKPYISCVSIKISTIYSQINLISWNATMESLAERLRLLYRQAMQTPLVLDDNTTKYKFVNLDMEEYRDLQITKELYKKVLSEPEFFHLSAGIVLQAYLPVSYAILEELTIWGMKRVKDGGAPIRIRIVKGANLAMEQVEASFKGWSQAPYPTKNEVDANFKKMISFACKKEHASAVHIGIGSHNLFDIAYTLLLISENEVEDYVHFEMLEGMADQTRRVIQQLSKNILLYCPVVKKEHFETAVAYLIRRLDENTGPENFLRHIFNLKPGSKVWEQQIHAFFASCDLADHVFVGNRRHQNRFSPPTGLFLEQPFDNEADTDFSSHDNRVWIHDVIAGWRNKVIPCIPLVINGQEIQQNEPVGIGIDPSNPSKTYYQYSLATWEQVDLALTSAKNAYPTYEKIPVIERARNLSRVAHKLREKRADLIGSMVACGGKTIFEADPEVSEAIDFAEYYARSLLEINSFKDIQWTAKGVVLVTPPWNFPIAIPCGGILAALAMGNSVIFKPAPEAVLCGWILVNMMWEAGIPKDVLQFINCEDTPVGSRLINDSRVSSVILTGATSTAKLFMSLRPGLDLSAETGGKNSIIVTDKSDRDLAIKDIIQSAFGHSGQKCSAASLIILTKEVYDDANFHKQLLDAVKSLPVGSSWDFSSKIVPLIRGAGKELAQSLSSLEPEETWLLEPVQDQKNPNLWSPGIKLGIKENSFMHQTELFGPVLGVMRADNLSHAIHLANGTAYGLTSGIHSLDEREQKKWSSEIVAGNLYINRTTTGAIVSRQPFGGTKTSNFGRGHKAGGPNYLTQFGNSKQISLPTDKLAIKNHATNLSHLIDNNHLSVQELGMYYASIASYNYWMKKFIKKDPSKIVGQDNFFEYRPLSLALRIQTGDHPVDIFRIMAAALVCGANLHISYDQKHSCIPIHSEWKKHLSKIKFIEESEDAFYDRVKQGAYKKVRLATPAKEELLKVSAKSGCFVCSDPVLANGRFELLQYLREVSISHDYHRYGNLGTREGEPRKKIL